MNFLLVFAGGGLGCVVRYLLGLGFQKTSLSLPWSTFVANITACSIFALVIRMLAVKEAGMDLRLLLLTGFCGGLSTFSSFGYETFLLIKQGLLAVAFLNILFNTACCIGLFYIFRS